ncbi:M1 family aminopeptidase [Winogradskyella haliclonae]|uniref:Membrane protein n=1 Tax=Winogradskyella haliclonae TaxID=2048558 RepID=A0ABQ2BYJ9_9FLAO|nr:M1 family aminopeptidase [Winogradskyella haliclonae]GGI56637.1 membrane protein [Winogradskyella haliclonae]
MFKTFFLSELKYTLKQPMVYIFMLILGLMEFFATVSDNVQVGGAIGNVYRNSPYTLTIHVTIFCIFSLLMAVAFFNNAALRDHNNEFNEILFTTPLSKPGYYFGRFLGALFVSTLPLVGVFIGMLLGTYLNSIFNWIDTERFGPFYIEAFVNNYLLFILPNMFLAGTVIFAMANKWKSTVISFVGGLVIIVAYIVAGSFASDVDNETVAALTDMFGINTYSIETKYYTPVEKNTLSPGFSGLLLYNRLIWIAVGFVILAISYFSFSFKQKNKKIKKVKNETSKSDKVFDLPKLNPSFTGTTNWQQFKSFFYTNFLSIIKSVTFKILFLFCIIILVTDLTGGFEYFGLQSYPVTYKLIDSIKDNTDIFIIIIVVFFSGELIWRDRDNKINEVIDATAHTSFISMAAKTLSLISIATILNLFFIGIGIIYQLLNGFSRIEVDVYLLDFFYDNLPLFIVFGAVTILVQVLSSNKYIGYFIAILILLVLEIVLSILDINSNMVDVAGGPSVLYSDMNSFGPGLKGALWFNLYWTIFSVLALLIAGALWNRGSKSSLLSRIKTARKEVPKSYRGVIIGVTLSWLAVAAFVYYNTQVLNPYRSGDTEEQLIVDFEKTYGKYRDMATPKVTDAKYYIDIFPKDRDVLTKIEIGLTNATDKPIDSVLFFNNENWDTKINIPNSEIVFRDSTYLMSIYKMSPPLQPGDTINAIIEANYVTKGFENGRGSTRIINNGTFLNNGEILPTMGYNSGYELNDKNLRRKYDLPEKERTPKLTPGVTDLHQANYLSGRQADFINVETIISTSKEQTAIAPGSLIKQWEEDNRSYFHYKADTPSLNFYSFISADFQIAKRKWNDVDIEIYHDKKHDVNIDMMLDAVERSLKYYTENFGPYYHKQARIIEFPRYANFAQAFPGTMPYSESFGFITNLEDETDNNVIDFVIAHEMAHQWWAHQLIGADMQGGTFMSEGFSQYSASMTMKNITENPMKMRKFLKYDHDRYLRGRSGEREKELPLWKVENQSYIHYGKGSAILYALQDYIGEDNLNTAMKSFLEEYRYAGPPYPSSHDFLRHLEPQVPDSLNYLIKDWFKEITLYDNRLKDATYKKLDNGKYQVKLDIESYKIKSDSLGNETRVPMNDWIDIGFFMDDDEDQLYGQKRLKFNTDTSSLTVELDSLPVKAAIDPRHILIDRVYKDNIKGLSIEE